MKDHERHVWYWLLAIVAFFAALYILRAVLLPFVLGMGVAYFLDPVADRVERWGLSRTLAAVILTVAFVLAVIGFLLVVAPLLQAQILDFAARVPGYVDLLRAAIMRGVEIAQANLSQEDIERLRNVLGGFAGDSVSWLVDLLKGVWSGGLALVNALSLIVITPIVAFYQLRDWDKMIAKIDSWLPLRYAPTIREQVGEIDRTLAGFVRGQGLVCVLLGLFYAIGLTIVGLDFGLIVGLFTGLISFVPYFGMLIGLVLSMGLAFAQFDSWQPIAIVFAIFAVGQILEGNFISPKLVGERVGLHPVWMIFALLAGGALAGFLGVLLAVPVAATIGVLARFGVKQYLAGGMYGAGPPSGGGEP